MPTPRMTSSTKSIRPRSAGGVLRLAVCLADSVARGRAKARAAEKADTGVPAAGASSTTPVTARRARSATATTGARARVISPQAALATKLS
eukprot:8043553-Pyramimonas_sp.AAC.1